MPDIPESVSREPLKAFVAALGLDPKDVKELRVWPDLIAVAVFSRDEEGNMRLAEPVGPVRERVAVDWVTIKIEEDRDV